MKKLLALVLAAATVASLGVTTLAASKTDIGSLNVYTDKGADVRTIKGGTTNDTVTPDQKVYVRLDEVAAKLGNATIAGDSGNAADLLNDKDFFKFSAKKGSDNSKKILSIKLIEKDIGQLGGRLPYIEIKLADDYSDDEFKISPEFTFTVKDNIYSKVGGGYTTDKARAASTTPLLADGLKFEGTFTLWIANTEEDADAQYDAGVGGVVVAPQKNEDNEIIWNDENRDIARLTFVGDSDVDDFFPKLSTKWLDGTYEEFVGQDAYTFRWIGARAYTAISSTSRATLEIYDPYYDEDEDEYTVDSANVTIYEVQEDGSLNDVTKNWTYVENDDGDMVYKTKTRTLGHYIFCEADIAGAQEEVPGEGEKEIPNTGR